ncbi:hypothetical protein GHT06_016564 [Daphnia sinensis]|uniref:Uncharacterized protein n=1 Tax=Daphnia sinensis TaxID=1820382 RepID=A0AAD5LFJ1_9CRUS|nr:hypothetical protein GHT06_016564 [Daphnia sinensis]
MPTWQQRNMPCSIRLKSRRWKKSVVFWKNCTVATSMLQRYCIFAPSVFRYKRFTVWSCRNTAGISNQLLIERRYRCHRIYAEVFFFLLTKSYDG